MYRIYDSFATVDLVGKRPRSSVSTTTTGWLKLPSRSAFLKCCGSRSELVNVMRAASCGSWHMSIETI